MSGSDFDEGFDPMRARPLFDLRQRHLIAPITVLVLALGALFVAVVLVL